LSSITAAVDRHGVSEFDRLAKLDLPAARLRQAYILYLQRETQESITTVNRLLFGSEKYGPAVQSYAYYIRSLAFDRQKKTDRARADRETAAGLAIDDSLKAKLGVLAAPARPKLANKTADRSKLQVYPRSAWSTRKPIQSRLDPMGRIYRVTVHHTGMFAQGNSSQETKTLLNKIQRQHQQERNWGDIGYHYMIDPAGRIWSSRSLRYQGAHAGNSQKNRGNVGVCLMGNFVGQDPTAAQIRSLERFLRVLCLEYKIPAENIKNHNEFTVTQCPGPKLEAHVSQIRRRLSAIATH
ncbi:MAG: peptidoglycan recognition protein family protein, partial [Planctomycetota bacterium]